MSVFEMPSVLYLTTETVIATTYESPRAKESAGLPRQAPAVVVCTVIDTIRDAMTLTYIWTGFFIVGFAAALAQWIFLGDVNAFKRIVDGPVEAARFAVMDIALPLAGVMTLWMGILAIGEKAGAIDFVARLMAPFF